MHSRQPFPPGLSAWEKSGTGKTRGEAVMAYGVAVISVDRPELFRSTKAAPVLLARTAVFSACQVPTYVKLVAVMLRGT